MLAELRERHAIVLRQRMVGGRDEHEVLVEERLGVEVGIVDRQVDDREVEAAGLQLQRERRRGRLDHDDAHPGVLDPESVEQAGNQPAGGGADDADAHVAGDLGAEARDVGRMASSSASMRRARATTAVPSSVSRPLPRSTSVDPARARAGRRGSRRSTARCAATARPGEGAVVGDGDQSLELSEVHRRQCATYLSLGAMRRSLITLGQIASHNGILIVTRSKWTRPPGSHLEVSFAVPPPAGLQVERAGQPPEAGPFPFSTPYLRCAREFPVPP